MIIYWGGTDYTRLAIDAWNVVGKIRTQQHGLGTMSGWVLMVPLVQTLHLLELRALALYYGWRALGGDVFHSLLSSEGAREMEASRRMANSSLESANNWVGSGCMIVIE